MKRSLIFFMFFALSLTCVGQSKVTSYTLSLEFAPSFMNVSTLIIHKSIDSSFVELKGYKSFNRKDLYFCDTTTLHPIELSRLTSFLKIYKLDEKKVKKRASKKKYKNLLLVKDVPGNDGINVDLSLIINEKKKKHHFWSPLKESEDGKLMVILFDIMQKAFPIDKPFGHKSYEYIKELKTYF